MDVVGSTLVTALILDILSGAAPAYADNTQATEKPAPLDDETRVRWMAHIVKGLINLAADNESPEMHYRYCVAGIDEQSEEIVKAAVAKLAAKPVDDKPWLVPILIEHPSYRPSAHYRPCVGGQFYFGNIGDDPLELINLHRRKQWIATPNWPPFEEASGDIFFAPFGDFERFKSEDRRRRFDQYYAHSMRLSSDLADLKKTISGHCARGQPTITFYFNIPFKRTSSMMMSALIYGSKYGMACLSVEADTLHIDLTEKLYKGITRAEN